MAPIGMGRAIQRLSPHADAQLAETSARKQTLADLRQAEAASACD